LIAALPQSEILVGTLRLVVSAGMVTSSAGALGQKLPLG